MRLKFLPLLFIAGSVFGQAFPQLNGPDDAVFTGSTLVDSVIFNRTDHGNSGSTEDFSAAINYHIVTLNANCTYTLSDFASSGYYNPITLEIHQDSTGGRSFIFAGTDVNLVAETLVPTSIPINPVPSGVTFVTLWTTNGATTIYAHSDYGGLNAVLPVDDTYSGTTITGLNAGATIAQWDAVYLDSSSTWQKADCNGSGTYPARGLAVSAGTNANPLTVLVHGTARNDGWTSWTVGGQLYLSGTAGATTQTAPSASGDHIQQYGFAISSKIIFVDFGSGEYLTVP